MNARGLIVVTLMSLALCVEANGADEPAVLVEYKLVQAEPVTEDGKLSADLQRLLDTDQSTGGRSGPRDCVLLQADFDVDRFLTPKKGAPLACKLLAGPSVKVMPGEKATVRMGQQIPYMVKRGDGSLVVEHSTELLEGVELEFLVGEANEKLIVLKEARMRITRVAGRQPIADVPFEVGRPIMATREVSTSLTVAPGRWVLIRLPQADDEGSVFLAFLRATIVDS